MKNKHLVVLAGPTASGKTRTGIILALHFQSEIISADSRQIYRETRIGTAVPSDKELAAVPHHFIQFKSLSEYYNASMFEVDVLQKLEELFEFHDIIFMVGGSGLYINAVCEGIDELPTVNMDIRNDLAQKFKEKGLEYIQSKLKELDPLTYNKVDLNNHFRILKALEVSIQTGIPYSDHLKNILKERDFHITRIALDMDRDLLYERINDRVDQMIDEGLVEEVESLQAFRNMNAMKTVGYREVFKYLDKEISLDEAIDLIKRNTRKYARKQLTWFRKNNLYPWFHPDDIPVMIKHIESEIIKNKNLKIH